tara:strand:+ start:193 stop:450 length:258 start_codon:yes stop_codon:yes gene_type:complete
MGVAAEAPGREAFHLNLFLPSNLTGSLCLPEEEPLCNGPRQFIQLPGSGPDARDFEADREKLEPAKRKATLRMKRWGKTDKVVIP